MDWLLWIKAFHVAAVLFWMAALFYLPRLFVYHAESPFSSARAAMLATMERRLLKIIATPSMLAAWLFGLLLLAERGFPFPFWLWLKIALVLLLTAFHGACARWRRELLEAASPRSPRFYRIANEIPPLLAFAIVLLAILKPWG